MSGTKVCSCPVLTSNKMKLIGIRLFTSWATKEDTGAAAVWCWSDFEEISHIPKTKEEPQQDSRRGEIAFRVKPHNHQRSSEGSNKPCAHQDPGTPQRDWDRTVFEHLPRRSGQQQTAAGLWVQCPGCGKSRLGGGHWEGNRQEGQGSPNGEKTLQVPDIFISLKPQEETNQRCVFPSLYKFKRRFLLKRCVARTPGLTWS